MVDKKLTQKSVFKEKGKVLARARQRNIPKMAYTTTCAVLRNKYPATPKPLPKSGMWDKKNINPAQIQTGAQKRITLTGVILGEISVLRKAIVCCSSYHQVV